MQKKIHKHFFLCTGLFLILFFTLPKISHALDIEASASRTNGVAPFIVQFNTDLSASSPTERSFHNLDYSWNFGDVNSGNWGNSGKPKNTAKGPVAAHVFESAGVYDVSLIIKDQNGNTVDTENFTITVSNADVYFAGAKTTCLSTSVQNDFNGCPNGATRIVTNDLATDLPKYTSDDHRVLLDRGSSWSLLVTPDLPDSDGPVQIGAYGECLNRSGLGICANDPQITMANETNFLDLNAKQHWTLSNITFVGGVGGGIVTGAFRFHDIFLFRLKSSGFSTAIGWSHWNNYPTDNLIENMSVVECDTYNTQGMQYYVGAEKISILGNIARNSRDTHVLRLWQGYRGVVSHNILSGSSVNSTAGRHALKFHGPIPCEVAAANGCLANRSEFTVVSNNIFGGSGPWPVAIGPQDGGKDERLNDIIFENNYLPADYGDFGTNSAVQASVVLWGRYFSIRNNVIDLTNSYSGSVGISIDRRGIEWTPLGHRIYNNTIYRRDRIVDSNSQTGISIHLEARDIEVANNLISFVADSRNEVAIDDKSGVATLSNNVMTDNSYFADPNNASPLLRNFSLTANSTQAINTGKIVPVFDDFTGNRRVGSYDIGAYEYILGGDAISPAVPKGVIVL